MIDVEPDSIEPFVNAQAVADRLNVSRAWVLAQAKAGNIPHYQFGHRRKFRLSEIDDWARANRVGQ